MVGRLKYTLLQDQFKKERQQAVVASCATNVCVRQPSHRRQARTTSLARSTSRGRSRCRGCVLHPRVRSVLGCSLAPLHCLGSLSPARYSANSHPPFSPVSLRVSEHSAPLEHPRTFAPGLRAAARSCLITPHQTTPIHDWALTVKTSLSRTLVLRVVAPISLRYFINSWPSVGAWFLSSDPG